MTNTTQKAAGASNTGGLPNTSNSLNFASYRPLKQAPGDKEIATLIAKLVLAGHAVLQGQCGDFTMGRWGQTRYPQDLAAMRQFARRVGVSL